MVLTDINGPRNLTVKDALVALNWPDDEINRRGGNWLVRFLSAALDEHAGDALLDLPCLLLEASDVRLAPSDLISSGCVLVTSLPESGLAALIKRAARLASSFRGRGDPARRVRLWLEDSGILHGRATDALALEALANADGSSPVDLSKDPELLRRLRNSFEQLPSNERERLGLGIGRNLMLAGFEFDKRGSRRPITVVPASAYIPYSIEKVPGWSTAAAKTPGIQWLDTNYAELLRTRRDDARAAKRQGALAFLRSIGAAVAPRLHKGISSNSDPYAALPRSRLTIQQLSELEALPDARTLRNDWDSRDLSAVLQNITRERVKERRKRSRALFQCLHRAWNQQYAERHLAIAAHHYRAWQNDGQISATWVGRLASEPWLSTRERRFNPKPPRELAVLTDASFEIEGECPERYAYELGQEDIDSPVLEAIRIEGKPGIETIITRLQDLRDAENGGNEVHQHWVDRCYRALSACCPGQRYEGENEFSQAQWRSWFGTAAGRQGLIRSQGKWLSIPNVRRGPYLGERVASVTTPAALWEYIGVPLSDVSDCRQVLESLAAEHADEIATEILALRRLIELSDQRSARKKLAGVPIRTYGGWQTNTTVYAIGNRSLAEEVGAQWPVWRLPISVDEAMPLLDLFGITLLSDTAFEPAVPSEAIAVADLQVEFPAIVTHLKNYLLLHNATLHDVLTRAQWQALAEARVALGATWAVKVKATGRRSLRITPQAYMFNEPALFCALGVHEAGQHDAGGRAVANYCLGETARDEDRSFVALAWESAFHRREEHEEAIDVDGPEVGDDHNHDHMPHWLRNRSVAKRPRAIKIHKPIKRAKEAPRQLANLDELDLSIVKAKIAEGGRIGKFRFPRKKGLAEPSQFTGGRQSSIKSPRAGNMDYTSKEREDIGFAIAEACLRDLGDLNLDDVRDQGNIGADAVDRAKDIWIELKTAGRERGDTVRLERSEAMRAKEKGDNYWLVIVWNLERPRTPELLVVENPLAKLDTQFGTPLRSLA